MAKSRSLPLTTSDYGADLCSGHSVVLGALLRAPQEADLIEPFGVGFVEDEEYNPEIHTDITDKKSQTTFRGGSRWAVDRYNSLVPFVSSLAVTIVTGSDRDRGLRQRLRSAVDSGNNIAHGESSLVIP